MLIQTQAAFLNRPSETDRAHAEFGRRHLGFKRRHCVFERETAERFAGIEAQMAEIIRVLNEHGRIMERLTEAVGHKTGFKAPLQP